MAEILDVLVIGAGVVGASVAHALREESRSVYVVDAAPRAGTGNTSRNSGVIHAGLYYPSDSLKTRLCRRGAHLLYAFAERHGVPCLRTGKYIVANGPTEIAYLDRIRRNAIGVPLDAVQELPKGVRADKALFSPNSGIIDSESLLQGLIAASRAETIFSHEVTHIQLEEETVSLKINGDHYRAKTVINCAGLAATRFCRGYRTYYARGVYFQIRLPSNINPPHLVYPAAPPGCPALGVHLTTNIHGETFLGPDLEWIDQEHYGVDPKRRDAFYEAASVYLPWLERDQLTPAYAGIRPKLSRTRWSDFKIFHEGDADQLIHCLGIESPGLTAAMAIGEYVAEMIKSVK